MDEAKDPRQRLAYDRTALANERTFAAWLRTGLAVGAGGVAITHVVPLTDRDPTFARVLGLLFVLVGVAMIILGARRFVQVNRDLSAAGSPSAILAARIVYFLTTLVAALMLAALLVV